MKNAAHELLFRKKIYCDNQHFKLFHQSISQKISHLLNCFNHYQETQTTLSKKTKRTQNPREGLKECLSIQG